MKDFLVQGFHSQEALEMVKTHVRHLMGEAVMQYDASVVRLPKLQAVQVPPPSPLPDTHTPLSPSPFLEC